MKRLLPGLVLIAVASACAPNSSVVYISQFLAVPDTCALPGSGDAQQGSGWLDVAASPPTYYVGIEIKGDAKANAVSVGSSGQALEAANRDRPFLTVERITYSCPKLRGFREWVKPVSISLGDGRGSVIGIRQLISPEAALVLDGLPASNDPTERTYLNVTVQYDGHMSGSNSAITTGPQVFPIELRRSEMGTCTTSFANEGAVACKPPSMTGELVCCLPPPSGQLGCP